MLGRGNFKHMKFNQCFAISFWISNLHGSSSASYPAPLCLDITFSKKFGVDSLVACDWKISQCAVCALIRGKISHAICLEPG